MIDLSALHLKTNALTVMSKVKNAVETVRCRDLTAARESILRNKFYRKPGLMGCKDARKQHIYLRSLRFCNSVKAECALRDNFRGIFNSLLIKSVARRTASSFWSDIRSSDTPL